MGGINAFIKSIGVTVVCLTGLGRKSLSSRTAILGLQRGMASWKRMLEVLETEPAIADFGLRNADWIGQLAIRNPKSSIRNVKGRIEFRDLVFGFDGTPVLNHVSATIEAAE